MRTKRDQKKYTIASGPEIKGYSSRIIFLALITITLLCSKEVISQENITTFGIQYKPIFATPLTGGGTQMKIEEDLKMTIDLNRGTSFGMNIRWGFTKTWSLETGINLVRRNFNVQLTDLDSIANGSLDFKFTNYEVPIQGLAYIQLGDKLYINTSLGFSLNTYPRNVRSIVPFYLVRANRYKKLQFALVGNVGFEYRTKESGYFYLGASFYNPFQRIGFVQGTYLPIGAEESIVMDLRGNYLTIDLRYFFHEKPEKRK